jgi:hypothetical protein
MDVDAAREKNEGKQDKAMCGKEHATTREDWVSRARDDRLAFKARLGAVTIEFFCGRGLALLACLCSKAWGKARSDKVRRACYGWPW